MFPPRGIRPTMNVDVILSGVKRIAKAIRFTESKDTYLFDLNRVNSSGKETVPELGLRGIGELKCRNSLISWAWKLSGFPVPEDRHGH